MHGTIVKNNNKNTLLTELNKSTQNIQPYKQCSNGVNGRSIELYYSHCGNVGLGGNIPQGLICCARERNLELPKLVAGMIIILEPAVYSAWILSSL
jgi:hypothetical protein